MTRDAGDQMAIDRLEMQVKNAQEATDQRGKWLEDMARAADESRATIARLERENAALLAALKVAREIACSLADPEHCLHGRSINWAQVRDAFGAAIERAS